MVQKYQNEIAPILYYGISTKTNEKDLKIPNLQPPHWKSPYWMTLYVCRIVDRHWEVQILNKMPPVHIVALPPLKILQEQLLILEKFVQVGC